MVKPILSGIRPEGSDNNREAYVARSFTELFKGRLHETALAMELDYGTMKDLERMISTVRAIAGAFQINVASFEKNGDGMLRLLQLCNHLRWNTSEIPFVLNGAFSSMFETPDKQAKFVFQECMADAIMVSNPDTLRFFTRYQDKAVFVPATPETTYRSSSGFDDQIGFVVKQDGPNLPAVRVSSPNRMLLIECGRPDQIESLVTNGQDNRGGNFMVIVPSAAIREGHQACENIAQRIQNARLLIP